MIEIRKIFITLLVALLLTPNSLLGQATIVNGSATKSKLNYSAGAGNNRLIVVAVEARVGGGIDATAITWGGQSLVQAYQQTSANGNLQVEIWYLNEVGIAAATAGAIWCRDFVVTWNGVPVVERFFAFTLKDVNQASPVADFDGANDPGSTTIALPTVNVAVNDFVCYAAGINANRTHTPPAAYTEIDLQTGANSSMAVTIKEITVAGTESPTATWSGAGTPQVFIVGVVFAGLPSSGPVTYYSLASGPWDLNTTWSLTSDGSSGALPVGVWPTRVDNVVIRAGHNVSIDATDDNKSCGTVPDDLTLTNVGPFAGSNLVMFHQAGDIIINGTLTVTGIEMMSEGYTQIASGGIFNLTSSFVNLGFLEADAGSTLSSADDLILAGNSSTIINTISISNDDLIISFTDATLCGSGTTTLQNGAGSLITYANGATVAQICTTFTVACTGVGCSGFPVVGTGNPPAGNTGPGGIEATNGTGSLALWLVANTISQANGSDVTTWNDQSGYGNNAVAPPGNEPVFNTNQINGFPVVRFTATSTDYLRVADDASLNPSAISIFVVGLYNNASASWAPFIIKATDYSWNNGYGIARNNGANTFLSFVNQWNANFVSSALAVSTNTIITEIYNQTDVRMFYNENLEGTDPFTTAISNSNNFLYLGISPNAPVSDPLDGDIAEAILINRGFNDAERIITHNYLAAKYGLALGVNDVYTMDDAGNGNYDFEVAGIGQAADGAYHRDARGTGVVRIWNPVNLSNGEFLMWGHDNTNLVSSNTVDVGAPIQERLSRIWRVGEAGDVGNVRVSFDISALANPLGSNLRLLIDRDGDGFADNDVTPIVGTVSGNIAQFSGVNFQDGDRFTLGNTDASVPLPVELISFVAKAEENAVTLEWTTSSELKNDFFIVQRSLDAEAWEEMKRVKGAGTTSEAQYYQELDMQPHEGISYYRLKQTDFDGKVSFSPIEKVEFTGHNTIQVFPNPSDGVYYVANSSHLDVTNIRIVNSLGQRVFPLIKKGTDVSIDLSPLSQGIYILQIWDGTSSSSIRLVKR